MRYSADIKNSKKEEKLPSDSPIHRLEHLSRMNVILPAESPKPASTGNANPAEASNGLKVADAVDASTDSIVQDENERGKENRAVVHDNKRKVADMSDMANLVGQKTGGQGVDVAPHVVKKVKKRRVNFQSAEIVEFEPTIYTTSVTSGGVPIGMSLKERRRMRRRLDSFESERDLTRVERQHYMEEGYLEPQEREAILGSAGCEEKSIAQVEAEVNLILAHRRESNEIDFDFFCGFDDEEVEGEDATSESEEFPSFEIETDQTLPPYTYIVHEEETISNENAEDATETNHDTPSELTDHQADANNTSNSQSGEEAGLTELSSEVNEQKEEKGTFNVEEKNPSTSTDESETKIDESGSNRETVTTSATPNEASQIGEEELENESA